jgi:hypothetical protein
VGEDGVLQRPLSERGQFLVQLTTDARDLGPSSAPPVELPVHQRDLRDGLLLFREHAPPADARPGQTPARSGTQPGYATSWDAIGTILCSAVLGLPHCGTGSGKAVADHREQVKAPDWQMIWSAWADLWSRWLRTHRDVRVPGHRSAADGGGSGRRPPPVDHFHKL